MKTVHLKPDQVQEVWYLVDAKGRPLGRLASGVASLIRGKHLPTFSSHLDPKIHVVIINAREVKLTGKKLDQKTHFYHTGYPGGARFIGYRELMAKKPELAVELAVWGMLPHSRLGRRFRKRLRIYAGPEHDHAAQRPHPVDVTLRYSEA